MWLETDDREDIEELGGLDELIHIEKTGKGTKGGVQFGDLLRYGAMICKYILFREVIKCAYSDKTLKDPEVIASTDC